MELSRRQTGNVQILSFSAEVELEGEASASFREAVRELDGSGSHEFVVDLHRVRFIDSSGLGALISLLKSARGQGGDLKLARLSGPVLTVLEITRLMRVFEVFDTPDDAATSFGAGSALASSGAREET